MKVTYKYVNKKVLTLFFGSKNLRNFANNGVFSAICVK